MGNSAYFSVAPDLIAEQKSLCLDASSSRGKTGKRD